MLWHHPTKDQLLPLWEKRSAALLSSGRTGVRANVQALQELMQEPLTQHILASAPAPASSAHVVSAMASLVADLCQALHAATDHVAWALLHALSASLSAGGFLYASWRDGSTSSHAVRGICWAGRCSCLAPSCPLHETPLRTAPLPPHHVLLLLRQSPARSAQAPSPRSSPRWSASSRSRTPGP